MYIDTNIYTYPHTYYTEIVFEPYKTIPKRRFLLNARQVARSLDKIWWHPAIPPKFPYPGSVGKIATHLVPLTLPLTFGSYLFRTSYPSLYPSPEAILRPGSFG